MGQKNNTGSRLTALLLAVLIATAAAGPMLSAACSAKENAAADERRGQELPGGAEAAAVLTEALAANYRAGANLTGAGREALQRLLEELAERERSGAYVQGLGLAESGLRENAGDYAGAAAAAYKELAFAYGKGAVQMNVLVEGLENVRTLKESGEAGAAAEAAEGILAFVRGQWEEAENILLRFFTEDTDPDDFANWMLLVCALEKDRDNRQAAAAYRAIRARYGQFPEYWYRGARAFAGTIAAEYAERCIGLSPEGPFAGECRGILASFAGLKPEDGPAIKSRFEIETIISQSVDQGNPEMLAPLIPLISLPENPYTVFALGALRALAAAPRFKDYFSSLASASKGRLAERLAYICRG